MKIPMKAIPGYFNSKPGVQVGTKMEGPIVRDKHGNIKLDMEGVRFLQQIGVEWLIVVESQVPEHSAACYKEIAGALGEHGLKIYRLWNSSVHNMPEVTLGLDGRDRKIEQYLKYIADLGEAGIYYTTYAHMADDVWSGNARRPVRGGATARGFDPAAIADSHGSGKYTLEMGGGRIYREEEIWENYEYFIKRAAPVAEAAGVFIGIHPDDPPMCTLSGVPRCIFSSFEGYKRALEIADSPNVGACLCVGCWLEGGEEIGCTPEDFIRYFGGQNKLFKVHMRNVTAPLWAPGGFNETFPDAGYYDMGKAFKALDEVGYDGVVMNDHLIDMVGGHYACEAYFTAYLKGMADLVNLR